MKEKQAMELVYQLIKLVAPVIHRENFNGDFERWLEREHYDVADACRDELYDTVYDEYCERENMDMAPYDLFNQIMDDIMHAESDFPFNTTRCDVCGAEIIYICDLAKGSEMHEHWDNETLRVYCNKCYQECFVKCDRCGTVKHQEEVITAYKGPDVKHYCKSCAGELLGQV